MIKKTLVISMALILITGFAVYAIDLGAGVNWKNQTADNLQLTTRLDAGFFSLEAPAGTDLGNLTLGAKMNLGFLAKVTEVTIPFQDAYVITKTNIKFFDNNQWAKIDFNTFKIGLGMPPVEFKNLKIRGEFLVQDPLDNNEREFIPQLIFQYTF